MTVHAARAAELLVVGRPGEAGLVITRSTRRHREGPPCGGTAIVTGQTKRSQRARQRRARIGVIQANKTTGMLAHVVADPAVIVRDRTGKMLGGHFKITAGANNLTTRALRLVVAFGTTQTAEPIAMQMARRTFTARLRIGPKLGMRIKRGPHTVVLGHLVTNLTEIVGAAGVTVDELRIGCKTNVRARNRARDAQGGPIGARAYRIDDFHFGRQVDPATIKSRDLDDIRPGGLGVHIIGSVMDQVEYQKAPEAGMMVRMTKLIHQVDNHDVTDEVKDAVR